MRQKSIIGIPSVQRDFGVAGFYRVSQMRIAVELVRIMHVPCIVSCVCPIPAIARVKVHAHLVAEAVAGLVR